MTDPIDHATPRSVARSGSVAALPLLVGVIPFGIVFGATVVDQGYGVADAVFVSTVVFAGAAQLALVDLSAAGAAPVVVVATALVINLRMLLYSASLAPHLGHTSLGRRLMASYVLTDQAYALTIDRCERGLAPELRLPFYFGVAVTLGASWVPSTVVGALAGDLVPDAVPLDLAVPLVFLTLLVPAVTSSSKAVAAAVGATAAVVLADLPANAGLFVAAVCGIAAGTLVATRADSTPEGVRR